MFRTRRTKYVSVSEMNEILASCANKFCYEGSYQYFKEQRGDQLVATHNAAFVADGKVKFELTTVYQGEVATFITFKDDRSDFDEVSGMLIYRNFKNNYYPELPTAHPNGISATPLLGYNEDFERQRIPAWGYDLNSAYSAAMMKEWIDTSKNPEMKIIDPETELGFDYNDNGLLVIKRQGFARWVFKKMEVPAGVRRYVIHWFSVKKKAAAAGDIKTKTLAKRNLNYLVGYFQRTNPWLRALIVCSCNEFIENLLDENSLFWNTDSIVSRVRRYDLEENIGAGLGQWKLEHEGVVAYIGHAYQWNNDQPTYRGVTKAWFQDGWDILRDPIPSEGNAFEFNKETFRLEETQYA